MNAPRYDNFKKSKTMAYVLMKGKSDIKTDSSVIWSRMCGGANQRISQWREEEQR